ncbi:BamA/TamA family outer membrane protein [Novosphingobium sp. SG707]|uniref:BamA/TamA family outer membrane protein n=1 Tax=Novosphingobium sp. SG707 TaxID=2586996 RepID=UPI001445F18D|nr:BamA/TamA family outer membrane protein [Novosphingobium sp. SG707]
MAIGGALMAGAASAQPSPAPTTQQPTSSTPPSPIITDRDFEAALPPVEAPVEAPANPVASSAQPTTATDPDLTKPLVPLDDFNKEALRDDNGSGKTETSPSLSYRWHVAGLENLRDADREAPIEGGALVDSFEAVSALKQGKGKATNAAAIAARIEQDRQALSDVMASQGYFDAGVQSSVAMPEQGKPGDIVVSMAVTAGPRYRLGAIRFDAPALVPPDLLTRHFGVHSGEPIVAERVLSAEAALGVLLPQSAYPFAKIGQRDIELDAATGIGDYTLPVTPGPRSRFGDIKIKGRRPVFDARHIATIARFRKGELYDSRQIDDLRKALVATNLFATVTVDPAQTGISAGDNTEYADLVVNQRAGPPRSLSAQAGYSTGEGIKAVGSWSHANLFPPEGAIIASATAGTSEQGVSGTFRRSNAGLRDRTVEVSLSANHTNLDAYEAFTGALKGRISRASTAIWQKRWTYSYGFELIGSNEQDYAFEQAGERRRTFYILALPGQITYDRSNSLLDPTRGYRLSATLSPEASLGSNIQTYARSIFEATGYYPIAGKLVLAGRARVGMIGGASRESIAPSRRFYSGGGGSVRGFGYQELGPKDPDGHPIGGRSQAETSVELRYRFGNFGVVGFVDSGQVFTSEVPTFNSWRFGAGVGVRYYTNFGPMRFDIATPINRQIGESRVAVYVSIGQAF